MWQSNVRESPELSLVRTSGRKADPEIGARVRDCRLQRGLSQAGLARTAGMGQGSLSNYELGKRGLSLEAAVRLATALDMTLADLVSIEERRRLVADGAEALGAHARIAIAPEPAESGEVVPGDLGDGDADLVAREPGGGRAEVRTRSPASTVLRFQVSERQVEIAVHGGPLTQSEIAMITDYLEVQGRIAALREP